MHTDVNFSSHGSAFASVKSLILQQIAFLIEFLHNAFAGRIIPALSFNGCHTIKQNEKKSR